MLSSTPTHHPTPTQPRHHTPPPPPSSSSSRLDLTSPHFDAAAYLANVHGNASASELETLALSFRDSLEEQTAVLQNLVKGNFARFVSCRTAVDALGSAMSADMEARGGDSVLADLDALYGDLEHTINAALGSVLDRSSVISQRRHLLAVLEKHARVVRVPAAMALAAAEGNPKRVVAEYSRLVRGKGEVALHDPLIGHVLRAVAVIRDNLAADLIASLADHSLSQQDRSRVIVTLLRLDADQDPVRLALHMAANRVLSGLASVVVDPSGDDPARAAYVKQLADSLLETLPPFADLCVAIASGAYTEEQNNRVLSRARIRTVLLREARDKGASTHNDDDDSDNESSDGDDNDDDWGMPPEEIFGAKHVREEEVRVMDAVSNALTEAFFPSVVVPSSVLRSRNRSSDTLSKMRQGSSPVISATSSPVHASSGKTRSEPSVLPFLQELRVRTTRRKELRPFMHAGIQYLASAYSSLLARGLSSEVLTPVLGVLDRVTRFFVKRSCSETMGRVLHAVADSARAWKVSPDGPRVLAIVADAQAILVDAFTRLASVVPPDAELKAIIRTALIESLLALLNGLHSHIFGMAPAAKHLAAVHAGSSSSSSVSVSSIADKAHKRKRSRSRTIKLTQVPTAVVESKASWDLGVSPTIQAGPSREHLLTALANIRECLHSVFDDIADAVFSKFTWSDDEMDENYAKLESVRTAGERLGSLIARQYVLTVLTDSQVFGMGTEHVWIPDGAQAWRPSPWALRMLLELGLAHAEISSSAPGAEHGLLNALVEGMASQLLLKVPHIHSPALPADIILVTRVLSNYTTPIAQQRFHHALYHAQAMSFGSDADHESSALEDLIQEYLHTRQAWKQFICFE